MNDLSLLRVYHAPTLGMYYIRVINVVDSKYVFVLTDDKINASVFSKIQTKEIIEDFKTKNKDIFIFNDTRIINDMQNNLMELHEVSL
jgi:hypothetical protein